MTCRNMTATTMAIAAALACARTIPTQAEPITFTFGGAIVEIEDDNDFLGGAVNVGDSFFGSYTFNSATPDQFPGDVTSGAYLETVFGTLGQIGSLLFDQKNVAAGSIGIGDNVSTPAVDVYQVGVGVYIGEEVWTLNIDLVDGNAAAVTTDEMPLLPPLISQFDMATFSAYSEREDARIVGSLTQLTPEPGAGLSLLILALLPPTQRRG